MKQVNKTKKNASILISIISAIAALSLAGFFLLNKSTGEAVAFHHIHGMGYTGDGQSLVVPAHDGLRIYENGSWRNSENEPNDYMGFSMTDQGFFSSGHPAPDSELENPLGIVKSDNFGASVEPLALYGEVDFHGMAAGYRSKAIYVMNPQPNSVMESAGLYFSVDEAESWQVSQAEGLAGSASAVAVHPDAEQKVALGTSQGVFLSADSGNTFSQAFDEPVSALSYTFDDEILAGSVSEKAALTLLNVDSLERKALPVPSLNEGEFVTYIAVNPVDRSAVAFSTNENNVYASNDKGNSWTAIVEKGAGVTSR